MKVLIGWSDCFSKLYCIKYTHRQTNGDPRLPLLGLLLEPKRHKTSLFISTFSINLMCIFTVITLHLSFIDTQKSFYLRCAIFGLVCEAEYIDFVSIIICFKEKTTRPTRRPLKVDFALEARLWQ